MEYQYGAIEAKWQRYWRENSTYQVREDASRPKFYVLDMFPYPSGAGLHVGHPLGYIASDIYARYKRHNGYNVLHPMGYDAYGLPAEQYAIQTGQHPRVTTEQNIRRYREQLDKIGFSFDWSREVRTCDPAYYKWTQWVFARMFDHYYDNTRRCARPISELEAALAARGTEGLDAACTERLQITAQQWAGMAPARRQEVLLNYRLAYLADTMVNWCPELGTVLANDEVKDGVSVRGGHPVYQKRMRQWSLRVSAYAERLLEGLEGLEWSESLAEVQRNWIGKSQGTMAYFQVDGSSERLEIFTTRPDTIYGATFMVLAPEHELVPALTTAAQAAEVGAYVERTLARTERERIADAKSVTGAFTGAYAVNPLTGNKIPIWIADYVLSGYGTGAIMAVPAHDSRDFAFARQFALPITQVVVAPGDTPGDVASWADSYDAKEGTMTNSGAVDGLTVKEAAEAVLAELESRGIGKRKTNYRLRDAIFSRQRYWGEPFPVYYRDGMPQLLPDDQLPLQLPDIDKYLPTEDGQPPLGRAKGWATPQGEPYELSTMPGFAGSSAYYLRYMDPHNSQALVSAQANAYWQQVDLYVGGSEHATGHLIYSRFWNKFLFDLGLVCKDEPYKKLINQGMIQGRSSFVYRQKGTNTFVSAGLAAGYDTTPIRVDIAMVDNNVLDTEAFRRWRPEFADAQFVLEEGKYICGWAVEKMSKSMFNVVNPDQVIERYGADTLRMYEMFLGPIEQSKPWDTKGIDGVSRFLKKLWRLFWRDGQPALTDDAPTDAELRAAHRAIKKVTDDIERFSFNTSVSAFMICVNELTDLRCSKRAVLEPLLVALNPFAPHITEELWQLCGHTGTMVDAPWPEAEAKYLTDDTFDYPVSFNGKVRFKATLPLTATPAEIEQAVLADANTARQLAGAAPKKVIVVPRKIVNIVV